jgi:hypothetical protein
VSKELVNGQQGLEGQEMLESQVINGWMERGRIQGMVNAGRANLLKVLRAYLPEPVPESVRLAIEGTNDPDTLDRWLDAALEVQNWAEFRAAMPIEG